MAMASQSDRNKVAMMQGLVINHRDASGSSTQLPWKGPPTLIPTPGTQRQAPAYQVSTHQSSAASSPYDGRLRNDLRNPAIGNVVSNRVPIRSDFHLAHKRRKQGSTGHGTRTTRESQLNGKERVFSSTDNSVSVIVVDDDEDVGERIPRRRSSPDPMNMTPSDRHLFGTSEQPRRLKADGPSTTAVKKIFLDKKNEVDVIDDAASDDIEPFDDDHKLPPKKLAPFTTPGNVRKKIQSYEPKIDLVGVRKKDQMRGKDSNKNTSKFAFQKDPIATSSSSFNHGGVKKSNEQYLRALPIAAWYFGTKRFSNHPQYWLYCEDNLLFIKQGPLGGISMDSIRFRLDREIASLQFTLEDSKDDDIVVLHFATERGARAPTSKSSKDHFTPGGNNDGKLTFKLSTTHKDWTSTNYQRLITDLRKKIDDNTSLDARGSAALWEAADRPVQTSRKRKQNHRSPELSTSRSETEAKNIRRNDDASVSASGPEDIFESQIAFQAVLNRPERQERVSRHFNPPAKRSEISIHQQTPAIDLDSPPRPAPPYKDADNNSTESSVLRRSTRQSNRQSAQAPPPVDPDELILVYPPDTAGAVNITNADLSRLGPNEFLNDTLIEFGLKLWLNRLRETNPELAESIHVFSSFFYKKLNNKNLAEGYQSVRKWTSRIDLFKKKYIIVPINEHLHWYLAIIYHPEHVLLSPPYQAPRLSISTRGRTALAGQSPDELIQFNLAKSPPLQDAPDEVVSPHTPSDSLHEVSAILQFEQCSLDYDECSAPPSASDQKAGDCMITPDMGVVENALSNGITLQYPSSPHGTDAMDVDAPHEVPRSIPSPMRKPGVRRRRGHSSEPETIHSDSSVGTSAPNSKMDNGRAIVLNGGVPAASFYGSKSSKGKQRPPLNIQDVPVQEQEGDELLSSPEPNKTAERPVTYIFTFDSLGTRHPQAIKVLKHYLMMEAKDKKGIEECNETKGKQALVPVQPNFCDCGLYLLHFAATFMRDPNHYCEIILTRKGTSHISERQIDWDDAGVGKLREKLTSTVVSLSEQWKRDRAARVEQSEGKEADKVESSDDDIDIVEDLHKPVQPPSKGKGKGKASYPKTKAQRLR